MPNQRWSGLAAVVGLAACGPKPIPSPPDRPPPAAPERAAFRVPTDAEIPVGPVGAAIRRGRAILLATRDSLPAHVGNDLRCVSCHMDAGARANASPWVGVYSRFPQYRSRSGRVALLEDRINDCFERSMNGKPLEPGASEMTAIVAYMAFLSEGIAPPGEVAGQGFKDLEPLVPDTGRGHLVFVAKCARCHGGDGQGLPNPDSTADPRRYPPLWGPRSYGIGAGMARVRTAASFIRYMMPFDQPGTLTDQEAFDVAGFIDSKPRPDFAGKENDWPAGDPPPDVAYWTRAAAARKR